MTQLRERLVATIRQWRPEILVTSDFTNPFADSAVEELVLREVTEAARLSGDPSVFPHHLTELGLAPWTVQKVYLTTKSSRLGDVHLTSADPTTRFGMPLEEMTFVSRNLVGAKRCPAILGFVHFVPSPQGGLGWGQNSSSPHPSPLPEREGRIGRDFLAGIQFPHGIEGRRAEYGIYANFQEEHRRKAVQRRNVLGLLQNAAGTTQASGQIVSRTNLASHAADLTRRLDADSAVQVLLNMAEQFHQEGDWNAAEETYLVLTRHYARHPLARQAFIRLMHYAVSGEILADEMQSEGTVSTLIEWVDDPQRPGHRIPLTVTTREPVQAQHRIDQQYERVLMLGQFLDQHIPDLANEVSMRFALASALRRGGWEQEAARFYQSRSNARFDDVWGTRARTEHWLSIPDKSALPAEQQEVPMPVIVATYTRIRPFLDGKFDEEKDRGVWRSSQPYSLTPATPRQRLAELLQENATRRVGMVREERLRLMSRNFGTQIMFLHNGEHLYIGLRCPKVPGVDYSVPENQPQLRDTGSLGQDRVEILIDVDRDYSTYYSLTIDSRGWVTDASLGNRDWNPEWHVVPHESEHAWYIEAAIPLSKLTQRPMLPNTVWNVAIRRLVPGVGIECWNAENSFELNKGFGLLVLP